MLHLIDYHVAAPWTNLDLPPNTDRMALVRGDYAKLVFKQNGEPHSESIWVKVEEVLDNGKYRGTLANDPIVMNVRYGDMVLFDWFNVVAMEMQN